MFEGETRNADQGDVITSRPVDDFLNMKVKDPTTYKLEHSPEMQLQEFFADGTTTEMRIGTDGEGNTDFDSFPPNAPFEHGEMVEYFDKWKIVGLVPYV
jgi:hypothetical protein